MCILGLLQAPIRLTPPFSRREATHLESLWPLLGALGIVLLDLSWFSQIVRIHRRRSADDVSVFFPLLNVVGRLLAMGYSIHTAEQVFTWGFLVGVIIRTIFLGEVVYWRFVRPRLEGARRVRALALPALLGGAAAPHVRNTDGGPR